MPASSGVLAQLSRLYHLQDGLLQSVPAADASEFCHSELGSLAWLFALSVYRELYWLRERLLGDADLTERVAGLFAEDAEPLAQRARRLPPLQHLRAWAGDVRDEHLRRLATPDALPDHPWLQQDRLPWFLVHELALDYERMLALLAHRRCFVGGRDHTPASVLRAALHAPAMQEMPQGFFRIGARDDPAAQCLELPPQQVELSAFRIARRPVSNAAFLAFMEDGGYSLRNCWSESGWAWLQSTAVSAPRGWLRHPRAGWYQVGLQGGLDLRPDDPVSQISRHEAEAFASWVSQQLPECAGAVVQHEYQWEVAARSQSLEQTGQVWEWCSRPLHGYDRFQPFPQDRDLFFARFDDYPLRGGCMHSQPLLRRLSFRHAAESGTACWFSGARLVFPFSG